MSQPQWKTLFCTDYSRVQIDETGVYAPEMEVAQDNGDDESAPAFAVYRFSLDKLKTVRANGKAYLVPAAYDATWPHPVASYQEWFADDLKAIAASAGTTRRELVAAFTSDDVNARAWAYETVAGYHGFANLDSDPLCLTEEEFNDRWK
jgi:hypothetical protein